MSARFCGRRTRPGPTASFGRRGTRRRSMARRPRRRPAPSAHVRIATVVNIARAIDELKALNVWTIGFDDGAADAYDAVDYTLPTALVLGAEGTGLRRLVRETCDRLVGYPDGGGVSSLNVSVAAGVALFEAPDSAAAPSGRRLYDGEVTRRHRHLLASVRPYCPAWHGACYHSRFVWLA